MTASVDLPAPAAAPRRPLVRPLPVVLAVSCLVLLALDGFHLVPSWLHVAVSPVVLVGALAVLVIVELGWDRTLTAAQTAGLVAARPA
ncbi:MAG: hypothetical protein ABWY93_31900 [Mycobacterium sp.]